MQLFGFALSDFDRIPQRDGRQLSRQAIAHIPANHLSAKRVNQHRNVNPTGSNWQVNDIGYRPVATRLPTMLELDIQRRV